MKKLTAQFFLFLAAAQMSLGQPMIPVNNLSPVGANSLVGNIGASGRGESIPIGSGLSFVNGFLVSTGSGGTVTIIGTPTSGQVAVWGNATAIGGSAVTGAGPVVAQTSPTLITPNLGTPSAINLANASGTIGVSGSNVTITGNLSVTGGMTLNNLTTSNLTVTTDILSTGVSDGQLYIGAAGTNSFSKANLTAGSNIIVANGPNSIAISATSGGGGSAGTTLIDGGGVALAPGGGFDITVSAANYAILGTLYSSAMTNLTLSASDPTNPRIDVVAVNTSGNVVIITGTPAATPAKPDVDPSTQLELTFFLVQAASTDLDVDVVDVYLNNAEWTTTQSGGTINVASTNNPYTGALCIEGNSVTTNNYVRFEKPAAGTFDLADSDNLVFYIRSKASWANNRVMSITVRNGGVQVGSAVTFDQGTFGFNSANTTTYQQIIVPTALFAANGLTANQIQITVGGSGGTLGFYIDDVTFQGGVASVIDSSRMKWRGNYVASNFYNVNDVVLSSGIQYVAIQSGVGNTPASSPTFWQASSTSTGGTVTVSGTPTSGQLAEWTSATNIQGKTLGSGVSTFLTTPTFTNLSSAVTGATIFANTTQSNALQAAQQVTLSSSGTDAFVGTAGVTSTAYTAGRSYTFVANIANTGAASLNVDGLGATTIVKVAGGITTTLADNDIRSGQVVVVAFDGTNFQLQSTLGNAGGGGSGTVNTGASQLLAYYPSAGNTVDDVDGSVRAVIGSAPGAAVAGVLGVYGTSAATTDVEVRMASADAIPPRITLVKTRGSIASATAIQSGDELGRFFFGGAYGANAFAMDGCGIFAQATEAWSGSAVGNKLVFRVTRTGTITADEALTLSTSATANTLTFPAGPAIVFPGSNSFLVQNSSSHLETKLNAPTSFGIFNRLQVNATNKATWGLSWTANALITGDVADDLCFRNDASKSILFSTDGGASIGLAVIAATGQVSAEKTTASTSTTTGALISKGGLGVAGRTSTATLNVGTGTTITSIFSASGAMNFGSINADAEETQTITVTGVATTNTPSVSLGWSAALEDGIVVKQAWVSGADTVSVRVRNVSGSPIDPASVTVRATVTSF